MSTHHAVLLSVASPLTYLAEEWLSVPQNNQYRLPQFGIDDVRRLISDAYRRPDGEETLRTLIVATEFITEEAQQALLKIIEEPPLSTRFIFVIPTGYSFLSTLTSRFERVETADNERGVYVFDAFKDAPLKERLTQIEHAVKNKDHAWQADVKYGLLQYLRAASSTLASKELKELEYIVRLLLTRGASNKFLLEHLALTLPA